jgi:hypothetical protein
MRTDIKRCATTVKATHFALCLAAAVAILGASAACTPVMNWRDVGFESFPVVALLPCKPERATRTLPILGTPRAMAMLGCEAGGAMFTVAVVQAEGGDQLAAIEKEWKALNKATHSQYQTRGTLLVQASVYGIPKAERDGPSALSTQAVETFLGSIKLTGSP